MSDFVNVFADNASAPSNARPQAPSSSGFVNVFAEQPMEAASQPAMPSVADMVKTAEQGGKALLQSIFPVASTIADVYPKVEPTVRPVVQAPVTGIGGLIDLAQGNSVQDAAQGVREGRTAGDYLKQQIPDTETSSLWTNIGGNLLKEGAGFLTDSGIYTGLAEGLVGTSVKPRVNINLDPSVPVESPSLPRPFDLETTVEAERPKAETFRNVFAKETPQSEGEFENVFKEVNKDPIPTNETPEQLKARFATELEDNLKKGFEAQDQGTNEPISMEEPLRHEPALTSKEEAAINTESGQVAIPDLSEMHNRLSETLSTSGEHSPIANLKADLRGRIAEDNFVDSMAIHNATKDLTPAEDQALVFMEKGKVPQSYRTNPSKAEVVKLIENPTPALQKAIEQIRPWLEQSYADSKVIDPKIHHVENYIPTMYKADPMEGSPEFIDRFKTKAGFTNERAFANIAEAIDAGMVPKYEKGSDILKAYSKAKNQAIRNIQFREALKKLPDSVIKPDAEAPSWDSIAQLKGYKVNPKYVDELAFLSKDRVSQLEKGLRAYYDPAASVIKKIKFMGGAFHGFAMGESGLQLVGPVNMALKGIPELFNSIKAGGAAFIDPTLTRRMLRANVNFNVSPDMEGELFQPVFDALEKGLEYAGKKIGLPTGLASKGLDALSKLPIGFEKFVSKALWTHEQAALKTMGFKVLSEWAAKKYPELSELMRDRMIGETLNDAFGSQSWELLMNDPAWQKGLQRVFMAPDYWISTLRMFGRGFVQNDLKGAVSRRWVANGIAYLLGGAALFNYAMTKRILGKGRFPWQNEEGKRIGYIFYGKDEKGHNQYFQVSKPFLEFFHLVSDPKKTVGNKLNPLIQLAGELLTGKTLSGFDLQPERPGFLGRVGKQLVQPIALTGNAVGGVFPKSQGMSFTRLETGLKEAIWKQELAFKANDMKAARAAGDEIMSLQRQAKDNNINYGSKVERKVRNDIRTQLKREIRIKGFSLGDTAQSAFDQLKQKMKGK